MQVFSYDAAVPKTGNMMKAGEEVSLSPMRILVVGANRPLGGMIALNLAANGHQVLATRRTPSDWDEQLGQAGIAIDRLDLSDLQAVKAMAGQVDCAVLTPILSISGQAARTLAETGISRGVVFSSNNVSVVGKDPVYDGLRAAEQAMTAGAPGWAILRPTMIYGYPGDGNLARLMRLAARWPVVPRPGSGHALQQPIHVEDLARLAAALATGDWAASGPLAVGGPDTLSHAELVRRVVESVRPGRSVLPVPLAPGRWIAGSLQALSLPSPLSPAQLSRVELDKAAVDPAVIPEGLQPRIKLEDGLARLAEEMGLTPPGR